MAFQKDAWKTNTRFSKDFEDYAPAAMQAMQAKKVPHWMQTLKDAMDLGKVKIKACGLTMDLFGLKLENLEPVVSEVTGAPPRDSPSVSKARCCPTICSSWFRPIAARNSCKDTPSPTSKAG
jgi:hypothetical protein